LVQFISSLSWQFQVEQQEQRCPERIDATRSRTTIKTRIVLKRLLSSEPTFCAQTLMRKEEEEDSMEQQKCLTKEPEIAER
jgi:hypothetical protein